MIDSCVLDFYSLTLCKTSIDDTAKFVDAHTEVFMKSAVEIASLIREYLNISRADT